MFSLKILYHLLLNLVCQNFHVRNTEYHQGYISLPVCSTSEECGHLHCVVSKLHTHAFLCCICSLNFEKCSTDLEEQIDSMEPCTLLHMSHIVISSLLVFIFLAFEFIKQVCSQLHPHIPLVSNPTP